MGLLTAKDKKAIRRGAWCNNPSVPAHLNDKQSNSQWPLGVTIKPTKPKGK